MFGLNLGRPDVWVRLFEFGSLGLRIGLFKGLSFSRFWVLGLFKGLVRNGIGLWDVNGL